MSRDHQTVDLIEDLVDKRGIYAVLDILADVCRDKAEWIDSVASVGSHDPTMARQWRKIAARLDKVKPHARINDGWRSIKAPR